MIIKDTHFSSIMSIELIRMNQCCELRRKYVYDSLVILSWQNTYRSHFIGTPSNIKNQGRQPSLGNISSSKRESEERNESRFVGARNFFSSLSGMTESGSGNDTEYYEQDYNEEANRVTRYRYKNHRKAWV